ncbi:MAG: hypothetical protein WHS88_05250 [Anaerohalosphaeraceae bacterium]
MAIKQEVFPLESSPLTEEQTLFEAGRAVRSLSHFVKNLLQMVGGSAEVAQTSLQTGNSKCLEKSLNLLLPNLERLRRTVLDLCEYSRIRPIEAAVCDIKTLWENALADLPAAGKEKLPPITLQTDSRLPCAYLDSDKIRQMFRHILIFLLDQKADSISVEIRILPNPPQWFISFAWEGILPENPHSLFEPAEPQGSQWGTGLDLPLAARFIHQHNGHMEAVQEGKNALLRLYLPSQTF